MLFHFQYKGWQYRCNHYRNPGFIAMLSVSMDSCCTAAQGKIQILFLFSALKMHKRQYDSQLNVKQDLCCNVLIHIWGYGGGRCMMGFVFVPQNNHFHIKMPKMTKTFGIYLVEFSIMFELKTQKSVILCKALVLPDVWGRQWGQKRIQPSI